MKRIFPQLLRQNYVTTTSAKQMPKGRQITKNNQKSSTIPTPSSPPWRVARSISISSGPGSIPTNSTAPPPIPVPNALSENIPAEPFLFPSNNLATQYSQLRIPKRQLEYSAILGAALDLLASQNIDGSVRDGNDIISALNVKNVLSKNEEMKKVILKVAAMALAQNEEIIGNGSLHPFITTAGEVFFGANYNEDGIEPTEVIQDILTPGLIVLLLKQLVSNDFEMTPSKKHMFLAKALVETSAGYLIHRTVQETNDLKTHTPDHLKHFDRIHQGNKLATLTGDLLVVSLIKHVASTGNNQVLELVMNSLSEFSTTEISKTQPFEPSPHHPKILHAKLPTVIAESIVFSKGFQSCLILSGISDPKLLDWANHLGTFAGLLWKTNFDWMKLNSQRYAVDNIEELNAYLSQLKKSADKILLSEKFVSLNDPILRVIRELIYFWGINKINS